MKETVWAIHPADIQLFLRRLRLLAPLQTGALHCAVCGDVLSIDTFRAAKRTGGTLHLLCTRQECLPPFLTLSVER
jgi:hypothetical protein